MDRAHKWDEEVIRSYYCCFAFWRISILVTHGKLATAQWCFSAKAMATALPGKDASHPGWQTFRQYEIRWRIETRVLHWIKDICITNCKWKATLSVIMLQSKRALLGFDRALEQVPVPVLQIDSINGLHVSNYESGVRCLRARSQWPPMVACINHGFPVWFLNVYQYKFFWTAPPIGMCR